MKTDYKFIIFTLMVFTAVISFITILPAFGNSSTNTVIGGPTNGNIFGSVLLDELNLTSSVAFRSNGDVVFLTITYPNAVTWNTTWQHTGMVLGGIFDGNGQTMNNLGAAGNDLGATNTLVATTFSGAVTDLTLGSDMISTGFDVNITDSEFVQWQPGGNAASRAWGFRNDQSAFGDFVLVTESVKDGGYDTVMLNATDTQMMRIRFGDKAGAATANDFWMDPAAGSGMEGFVYDTANGRLYWYGNGGVHYVTQTAGFEFPNYELKNFNMKSPFQLGDTAVFKIDGFKPDGAAHALPISFDIALEESKKIQELEKRIEELEKLILELID